ncbi:DUF2911 domain-containing protein [Sphingobacterium bovistauri]|uniref:DUF2911 domain-containing protein n=1 Tax=Sphingobacterium bovistauri TaxID=2781959 RepID=A0ABS7Z6B3_9SPHI|nr:DUF2911 domain-containing protein [Sphingobacterium bovistauri]MCA5005738.1 DUF2911 domain-containing protein [Sphingobacterium bovistauri]
MKKTILSIATVAMLFLGTELSQAQVKLPPASSTTTIIQGLGIKNIILSYQRPSTKGRKIFGELVPYNEVWRTGANNIPTITFDEEVTIEGNAVPAGTYGIFTIPNPTEWTVILSKNPKQWGAYQYKKEDDFLRFKVKPQKLANKVETFTITFDDVTTNSTHVSLAWENTEVGFAIKTDQSKEIMASIDEAMQGEKKPYFQAAQFYFNNNLDIKKAADWVKLADEGNTGAPHIKYWKSRILAKAGDKAEAKKAAQEGIEIATKAKNGEYIKLNTEALKAVK